MYWEVWGWGPRGDAVGDREDRGVCCILLLDEEASHGVRRPWPGFSWGQCVSQFSLTTSEGCSYYSS